MSRTIALPLPDSEFRRAAESFKSTLPKDDQDDYSCTTLEDLKIAVHEIQESQNSNRKMQDFARLRAFLEAMEQYDKVVNTFLNVSGLLAFIWVSPFRSRDEKRS
jgi:hypothetical protein